MLPGIWALLERSLRIDARSLSPHLVRSGLTIAIYVTLCIVNWRSDFFGAPGLYFFQSMTFVNLAFITLFGVSYFSSSITEEKEEETLGLMLMAGISPLGILLGKSGGRLIQGALLIAVQYPFTLLAVTMGGILTPQIQAVYLAMFSYLVLVAGVGVLCSTLSRTNRTAAKRMTILMLAYVLIPLCCSGLLRIIGVSHFTWRSVLIWISDASIFTRLEVILASGFQGELISRQVLWNGLTGALGFALSWLVLIHVVKDLAPETTARSRHVRTVWIWRVLSPSRLRGNPFVWKDFHFSAGGRPAILTRLTCYSLGYLAFIVFSSLTPSSSIAVDRELASLYLLCMTYALTFDAGQLVSRGLHDEVRGQTLTSLVLLPESIGKILYSKLMGSLAVWSTGPIFLAFAMTVIPQGLEIVASVFQYLGFFFTLIMHFLLVPHVAAVATLYVRWGAMAIGICAAVCSFILMAILHSSLQAGGPDSPFFYTFGMFLLVICAGCHLAVRVRAESLAARS